MGVVWKLGGSIVRGVPGMSLDLKHENDERSAMKASFC